MKACSILLVDDEESIRVSLTIYLEEAGYKVFTADSGEKAIEVIQKNHFDILITDLKMPGWSGIEVLKRAKNIQPDLIVMMLTGYGTLESAVESIRFGAYDYLQKPCSNVELLFRVQRCVDHLNSNRKIKMYEKLLPVCCACKKLRDDDGVEPGSGKWMEPDLYLELKTNIQTSHTYCDECAEKLHDEIKKVHLKRNT